VYKRLAFVTAGRKGTRDGILETLNNRSLFIE
jgi:hypothetical protein